MVGIIGRNGAGKSTLLKNSPGSPNPPIGALDLLRAALALCWKWAVVFIPELTGHENIYLNGAILGMKKTEIERKFNEIVDFAEIDNFLDTPVKRYSSGMYVRLAFAVAAHLEPEILMVDGGISGRRCTVSKKKCLGKMSDVAKEGRTVLFVSHNLQRSHSFVQGQFYSSRARYWKMETHMQWCRNIIKEIQHHLLC